MATDLPTATKEIAERGKGDERVIHRFHTGARIDHEVLSPVRVRRRGLVDVLLFALIGSACIEWMEEMWRHKK
jgi:hypothetical protein